VSSPPGDGGTGKKNFRGRAGIFAALRWSYLSYLAFHIWARLRHRRVKFRGKFHVGPCAGPGGRAAFVRGIVVQILSTGTLRQGQRSDSAAIRLRYVRGVRLGARSENTEGRPRRSMSTADIWNDKVAFSKPKRGIVFDRWFRTAREQLLVPREVYEISRTPGTLPWRDHSKGDGTDEAVISGRGRAAERLQARQE
jgi:hypothetical protein